MEIMFSQFPLTRPNPSALPLVPSSSFIRSLMRSALSKIPRVAIRPPSPGFDYKSEILEESRSVVAARHPELRDLADDGTLVLVEKRRFGPVPAWRSEFVEPETIWLIGTSHISEESAADVERVIRALRPDNVVVELCRSRAGIMYASNDVENGPLLKSNMFSLSGAKFLRTVNRSINLDNWFLGLLLSPLLPNALLARNFLPILQETMEVKIYDTNVSRDVQNLFQQVLVETRGQSAFALRLLLAIFSSKISFGANRPFGDEFRAARKASEEVGAQIVLGDRPIEITLGRAWSSLVWREKLKLLISIFRGIVSPSFELPEIKLKNQEMDGSSFQLYDQLSNTYPSLLQPLIHERDTYLAWSLKRSKAVNNSKGVVGVIGKGHMNGVVYALITDQGNLRFRDLVGRTSADGSNSWIVTLLWSLFRDTIIAFVLWALYEQLKTNL